MREANIFKLIHAIEAMNNDNIKRFTKAFPYPIGISPILVLHELRANGPQKQVDLALKVGYTKGAMTHIANKLVDLGLAERLYDENDRRIIQLQITASGEKALLEAQKIGHDVFTQLFEVLSEDEIHQYLNIQEKLVQSIHDRKNK